jgi:hypothetical protein
MYSYSAVDDVQVRLSVIGSFMSRVEQHMLNNVSNNNTNNNNEAATVTSLVTRSSHKTLTSDSTSSKGVISVDSISELQLLDDDVDAVVLKTIVENSRDTDITTSMDSNQLSNNTMSADSLNNQVGNSTGYGRALDSQALTALPCTLASLQVEPNDITKVHEHYIGRGGFAKVYKVNYNDHGTNRICAAKVLIVYLITLHSTTMLMCAHCAVSVVLSS